MYMRSAGIDTSCIRGVIGCGGLYNIQSPTGTLWRDIVYYIYCGSSAFGYNWYNYSSISPITYVDHNTVPHCLINAESEYNLVSCSNEMYEKLLSYNILVYHYIITNTTHTTIASRVDTNGAVQYIVQFIQQCQHNHTLYGAHKPT